MRAQGVGMTPCTRLVPVLLTIAAVAAGGVALASPAWAAEPEPAAAPAPLTIGEQIDNYIRTSPAAVLPKDNASGVVSDAVSGDEPRQVHGMVDVTVGSNGYRSALVASELPIGKTGTATIAVRETQFKGRYGAGGYGGPGYGRFGPQSGQDLALGLSFGGADSANPRCRQAAEDGAVNLDPRFGGGRACRAAAPPP
jgi:hypothetical protein